MSKVKINRALISVSDKTGIDTFAQGLHSLGVELVSTGGTAKLLKSASVPVTGILEFTGFPEILDGRVKTLHPKVHGALLAVRDNPNHIAQLAANDIGTIDMVVVNLYPFERTVSKPDVELADAIENIDIGGPSMLRSAAKNFKYVAVVTDPSDYEWILEKLRNDDCTLEEVDRFSLAKKVFLRTAEYDTAIASYLADPDKRGFPQALVLSGMKVLDLRYGENPHQSAAFYHDRGATEPSASTAKKLSGKDLSFNNIIDLDAAMEIVKEFDQPATSVIKHTNPCGAAVGDTIRDAFAKAYLADPVSAFGSIIGCNRTVDGLAAEAIADPSALPGAQAASGFFIEAIIAPGYTEEALDILTTKPKWGKSLRVMEVASIDGAGRDHAYDVKKVTGGLLLQDRDLGAVSADDVKVVTETKCDEATMADLLFAWRIVKHVRSNAIVLASGGGVTGVGAGQMSRVDATELAIRKAGEKADGSVLASDAFFPFPDAIQAAAEAGIRAIIQPGGSVGDDAVIETANGYDIVMAFTGMRHFRH